MPDRESIPQSSWRRFLTAWTAIWIAAWAGLFVVMHTPVPRDISLPQDSDKVIHGCAYFTLALLGARSALSRGVALTPRWVMKWLLIYLVYCGVDELLQGPVNRSPSVWDWLADAAGVAAAMGIAYVNRPTAAESDLP
ncbi:MAG: VanZ family protein [Planctomycetota bacterium]